MNSEDDEFNRIERESRMRQEAVRYSVSGGISSGHTALTESPKSQLAPQESRSAFAVAADIKSGQFIEARAWWGSQFVDVVHPADSTQIVRFHFDAQGPTD